MTNDDQQITLVIVMGSVVVNERRELIESRHADTGTLWLGSIANDD